MASPTDVNIGSQSSECNDVVLHVRFDVGQVTSQMMWDAEAAAMTSPPQCPAYQTKGRNAGSVAIQPSGLFTVKLRATVGNTGSSPVMGLDILDATIITIPHLSIIDSANNIETWAITAASPFFDQNTPGGTCNAVLTLCKQPKITWNSQNQCYESDLGKNIRVAGKSGRWKLSVVVTAAITIERSGTMIRVFHFDPECEVGTGIDPP